MKIEKGIIQDKVICGIEFKLHIVEPKGKANVRTLKQMTVKGLTIHNTANTNITAGDEQHGKYLQNLENADKEYKSWHFTVDSDSITQHLPLTEQGYHASDGSGEGNSSTIAIEIAENKDYEIAEENAIKLIVELMKHYNIKITEVLPHRYYAEKTKKLCPRRILKSEGTWREDWLKFQERVMVVYNKQEVKEEVKQEVKQEVGQVVYNKIEEVPSWYRGTVEKLIDKGVLNGNSKGDLGLSEEMCRIFTVHDRLGLYD